MISVVIATLNDAAALPPTLDCLVPAAVDGLVREVLVADGGSTDATLKIAEGFGATVLAAPAHRASRLSAGSQNSRFPWLLFIEPGSVLDPGWEREATQFMERIEHGRRRPTAGVFRYAVDDHGTAPRFAETIARWSTRLLGCIHEAQAVLLPRPLLGEAGEFRLAGGLEFADLGKRLGRRRLTAMRTASVASPARYLGQGYVKSELSRAARLGLFTLGAVRPLALPAAPAPHQAPLG